MKNEAYTLLLCVFSCTSIAGCKGNDNREIEGVVVTTSSDLVESFAYVTIQPIDGEYRPISGAEIRLAFDREGRHPVASYEARSDVSGKYTIRLKGIPRSPTKYGNEYYLLVKKEGYEPLTIEISIGPFGRYMRNTIVLKPRNPKGPNKTLENLKIQTEIQDLLGTLNNTDRKGKGKK